MAAVTAGELMHHGALIASVEMPVFLKYIATILYRMILSCRVTVYHRENNCTQNHV